MGRGGASFLGVCLQGEGVSQHALRQIPPPVNRMTDTSKNITLTITLLWPVTRMHSSRMHTDRCSGPHVSIGGKSLAGESMSGGGADRLF